MVLECCGVYRVLAAWAGDITSARSELRPMTLDTPMPVAPGMLSAKSRHGLVLAGMWARRPRREAHWGSLPALASVIWKGVSMRKIRTSKRHPAKWRLEPLPLDLRDRDIMRAKQLARSLPPSEHRRTRSRRTA